jgi:hypothetical protein
MGSLVMAVLVTAWAIERNSHHVLALSEGLRLAVAALSLAPLATLMGMPYPFGLAWIERKSGTLIPLAWAVNGCASVVHQSGGSLALSFGFTLVLIMGAGVHAGVIRAAR